MGNTILNVGEKQEKSGKKKSHLKMALDLKEKVWIKRYTANPTASASGMAGPGWPQTWFLKTGRIDKSGYCHYMKPRLAESTRRWLHIPVHPIRC